MPIIVKNMTAETVNIVKNGLSLECEKVDVKQGNTTTTVYRKITSVTYSGRINPSSQDTQNYGQDGLPHMRISSISGDIVPYFDLSLPNSSNYNSGSVITAKSTGIISGSFSALCKQLNLGTSPAIAMYVDGILKAQTGGFTYVGQNLSANFSNIPVNAGSRIWFAWTKSVGDHKVMFNGGPLYLTVNV